MSTPLKVLFIEDSSTDVEILIIELRRNGFEPTSKRVETEAAFLAEIKNLPDIILSDYSLPRFSGLRAAKLLQESGLNIPFILVSGTVGEEVAVEAMQVGATDYLLKDRIGRLGIAVQRALAQKNLRRERDRAEEALRQAGALQRAISNSAMFSNIATDAKGVIQIFNVGAERMLGYTAAEVTNQITPAALSDPQELIVRAEALSLELGLPIAPGFEALVFKASRGIEDIYELTYIRKDGHRLPAIVSVTALRDAHDGIIGYLLIGTDNTLRQQVEEERKVALRELHDVRAALDEHAIVAITDPKGRITYVNDKFCAISKYPRDELIGQDHRIINSHFHPPEFIRGLWQTISSGQVWKGEIRNRAKDGTFYWVDTAIVPCRGEDGKPIQYIAIRADITARKRFEAELQESNVKLESAKWAAEKASIAKSDFLSSVSHELRTPLNGIIGFTEFLIDEKPGPLKPKQKEYLGDVLSSGRHLLQLINDVLDLAKVESGKMELHVETFPVRKAIEEVTAVIKGIAHKKHIAVLVEVAEGLEAVTLDQHKFKQVLYNLLSNAVKFTDDDGTVTIEARSLDGNEFEVRIRDTGIGIRAEDLGRLFNEFEQLDSGLARRFEGTGLGLALTKKFIEFQGGRIGVESEPGRGSVFTVVLPVTTVAMELR
ncbi:MAG: hybrid sensor histidine kinase/response regulator [Verrucomicrobia bacterium]|nr:hybrid sensor histidine kinase/response regulator [Verrucomicrobiota bacterium]